MAKLTVETKLGYQMAHIEDVYIDKNHRRKGFGSLLVQHLVDRLARAQDPRLGDPRLHDVDRGARHAARCHGERGERERAP